MNALKSQLGFESTTEYHIPLAPTSVDQKILGLLQRKASTSTRQAEQVGGAENQEENPSDYMPMIQKESENFQDDTTPSKIDGVITSDIERDTELAAASSVVPVSQSKVSDKRSSPLKRKSPAATDVDSPFSKYMRTTESAGSIQRVSPSTSRTATVPRPTVFADRQNLLHFAKDTKTNSLSEIALPSSSVDTQTHAPDSSQVKPPVATEQDSQLKSLGNVNPLDPRLYRLEVGLSVDMEQIVAEHEARANLSTSAYSGTFQDSLQHATVNDDNETAEKQLSLSISKDDFFGMDIIGQFNLGFIIVRRRGELFIVDQHASDEKSNYEKLVKTTVLQRQRLAVPRKLHLTAVEENVIADHRNRVEENGFELIDLPEEDGDDRTCRFSLSSLPLSKNITFDVADLQELLAGMMEDPEHKLVHCSKATRMFASRACRSSIMIGTALTHERMSSIVYHMGSLDSPWSCPHGRPTMRHLGNLDLLPIWKDDYCTN